MAVLGIESVWVCAKRWSLPCVFISVTSFMSISVYDSVHRYILTLVHPQRKFDILFKNLFHK